MLQRRVRGAKPTILQLRADPIRRPGAADNCLPNIASHLRHCHLADAHGYRDGNVLYLHVPSGDYDHSKGLNGLRPAFPRFQVLASIVRDRATH